MAAAQKASIEKELDDITECSICIEVFTDPRVLPCSHTFCLKCLLNYGKDREPGDDMPCPLCRKEFTIPDNGLSGIQKNFLMEKLLHTRKRSAGKGHIGKPCDACSSEEAGTRKPTSMKKREIVLSQPAAACDIHKGEVIKVFCLECNKAHTKSHKTHDCSDNAEVAVDLRRQMKSDTDKASELLKRTEEVLPCFEKEKRDLIKRLADVEGEINTAADKLIDAVQYDRAKLLSEIESIRQKRVKQLETVKQEVEQYMTALESLKRYSETLLSNGTDCDVMTSANSLHERAEELMMFDVVEHLDNFLPPIIAINVKFSSCTDLNTDIENIVGTITDQDEMPSSPAVTRIILADNEVGAVTSLDNEVFVARHDSQTIEVYDAVNFNFQRRLAIPGLGSYPLGLAACARNKCLYASDNDNASVHRVELSGSKAVKKWSVAGYPVGVTVNNVGNVVVLIQDECKLEEFTTHGTLVRNIQLQANINQPRYALQLTSDRFLVSHSGSLNRVCLVDVEGAVIRSFGGQRGSDLMKMNCPAGLAVDKDGRILVADQLNNRLLVLDHSLTNAHAMSVSVDGGLNRPRNLWYDKSRGRLYIGEWGRGRVIIIDHLKDFTPSQV